VSGDATLTLNWLGGLVPVVPATVYDATFGPFSLQGNVTIPGGATITFDNVTFADTTQAYSFSGSGSPILVINGTLTTSANEAPITFNNSVNLSLGPTAGEFTLGTGSLVQVYSPVSGGGGFFLNGSGTLTLGSAATYTGPTYVEGSGTMQVVSGGSLNGTTALYVGYQDLDNATLVISGGGIVTMGTGPAVVGSAAGSTGTLAITGAGSALSTPSTTLVIGSGGSGTLSISNQGTFNGSDVEVGYSSGSSGTVTVDGSGSVFSDPSFTLYLGEFGGSGLLAVTNGGSVTTNSVFLAYNSGSGEIVVNGAGSSFANGSGLFYAGYNGTGSIFVSNGGSVSSVNSIALGVNPTGTGTLTLSSGGTATIGGGAGILSMEYGTATLNIGAASGSGAAAAGALNASAIAGYGTNDTVQFNTTATSGAPYYFTKDGTSGTGAVLIQNNAQVVNTAGYNILSGNNSYTGATVVNGGTLAAGYGINAFGGLSAVTTSGSGVLALNGFDEEVGSISGTTGGINLGSNTLYVAGPYSTTYGAVISGAGGNLNVEGYGSLTLTNAETYSGSTTIATGTILQLGNGTASGSVASAAITDNGTLVLAESAGGSLGQAIVGSGGVTQNGSVTTTLTGANAYTGATVVNDGTLAAGSATAFGNLSAVTTSGGSMLSLNGFNVTVGSLASPDPSSGVNLGSGALTIGGSATTTYEGVIAGPGSLVESGSGTLILANTNTYLGGTTINSGATLQLGNGENTGSIVGNVTDNGTLAIDNPGSITLGGVIGGSGGLTLQSGTVTLSGSNYYYGATYIEGGSLFVTNSAALGNNSGVFVSDSESQPVLAPSGGNVALSNPIAVPNSGLALNTNGSTNVLTLNGSISNYGDDFGALVINGPVVLNASNSYNGGTTINNVPQSSGGVTLGADLALGTGSVTATGSFLNFTSASPVIDGLSTVNSVIQFAAGSMPTIYDLGSDSSETLDQIILGSGTELTIGEGVDPKYYGTISGGGSVTLISLGGGAELDLEGANTYTGGTTVGPSALLVADNSSALGTGPLTLNNGSSFGVNSGITITNQIVNNGGAIGGYGTIAPASPETLNFGPFSGIVGGRGLIVQGSDSSKPIIGTLTVGSNASVNFSGGSGMQFSITDATQAAGTGYSTVNFAGNVTFDSSVSPTSQFNIGIIGVDGTGTNTGDTPYTAVTFNTSVGYSWTLMTASSITFTSGFNAGDFNIDTTNFTNSTASHFYVTDTGTSLMLNFTPVPEPSTWALMIGGLCVLAAAARRRRRA
jgi:fibronectin-binding autotransporter adhesin